MPRKGRKPREPRKGLSRRQRKLVVGVAEGKPVKQAMQDAGYRSRSLKVIFRGNRFRTSMRELLDKHGYTDVRIVNAFGEALQAVEPKYLKSKVTKGEDGTEQIEYAEKLVANAGVRIRAAEDLAQMRGMMEPPASANAVAGVTFIVNGLNPGALRPASMLPEKVVGGQRALPRRKGNGKGNGAAGGTDG